MFSRSFQRKTVLVAVFTFIFVFIGVATTVIVPQGAATATPFPTPPPVGEDDKRPVRIATDLVSLTLTVSDSYGRYVSGLKKTAFRVYDNNQEQEITFFSDSDAPVSVGILFDVSGSMNGEKIRRSKQALEHFVKTSHPSDEYFLISFNQRAQLVMDRTRDGQAVSEKLTMVKPGGNTALYDAVYLGLERETRGSHQKRALLIISDGQDNSSRFTFNEVRRLLKEADVLTYAIGILDRTDTSSLGMQGQAFLDELASVTGGKAFYPKTDIEMDEIFERIALELRNQYSIGYTPKDFNANGKWRKLKVKVTPPRGFPTLSVRSREGYYATPQMSYK